MKNIDILMVARPDHSLQIYEALLKQDNHSFLFLTFKVFPNWMRHLIKSPKAFFVNNNVKISWHLTAINFLIYKLKSPFVKPSYERNLLSSRVSRLLKKDNYKVVYYWPHYCQSAVEQFAKEHPETICIADVHLPNPSYVCETMRPVYVKYGIDPQSTHIYGQSLNTLEALVNAPAIMAPSQYVVETYKSVLPEKKYYVVDYGISVYEKYLKKNVKVVKDFVYAGGTISLEKGCDLLCEYFHYHTTYNLHLYGNVPDSQKYVFEKYKNSGNIYFHGHIPKANLQERIVQYDAGIHLSRFDAYSLSVGEMIGSGLPCVLSVNTGNATFVREHNLGVTCELNMLSIDKAISEISNPENYSRFSESIDVYIKTNYKTYGERMVEFFDDLVNQIDRRESL